jgi:hypothetical protein
MITIYLQNETTLYFEDLVSFDDFGVLKFAYKVFDIDTGDFDCIKHARFDKEKIIGYSVSEDAILV